LEERLGSRLLQRSTRRLGMTEIGETYYRHCVAMVAEAEAAQEAVDKNRAEPRGSIRVTCPVSLMFSPVSRIVSRYLLAFPLVRVQVSATNRRVDVIEEGIDVALRVRFPPLEKSAS
jgi:DNA-binding transcriptional LysR family regulator